MIAKHEILERLGIEPAHRGVRRTLVGNGGSDLTVLDPGNG